MVGDPGKGAKTAVFIACFPVKASLEQELRESTGEVFLGLMITYPTHSSNGAVLQRIKALPFH